MLDVSVKEEIYKKNETVTTMVIIICNMIRNTQNGLTGNRWESELYC